MLEYIYRVSQKMQHKDLLISLLLSDQFTSSLLHIIAESTDRLKWYLHIFSDAKTFL